LLIDYIVTLDLISYFIMTAEDIKDDMDDAGSGMGSDEGARPGESEEDLKNRKRKERLEQNRISARESRKRKKTMIEELQRTVITLSRENKGLNERNETLRRQLMDIGAKVCNVSCLLLLPFAVPLRHQGLPSLSSYWVMVTLFSTGFLLRHVTRRWGLWVIKTKILRSNSSNDDGQRF
jgi:hypothetical protein